ncbi:hypothetical protein ACIBG8_53730 [Nonomuraea sp. NPDC050556]|uniref:hypothetical protein n=1 Tax=Nonomuraea sp. NPDC050556 TaxID=3364369 RepID=UPI0037958C97
MPRFGVRELSLALMHRMRDLNPERVEDALSQIGATRAELRAAHTQWTAMAHSSRAPKGLAVLRMALGPQRHSGSRTIGALTCEVARWALPYWPGLELEALVGPDGEVWNLWFVRPSGELRLGLDELVPWTCVIADVAASFPGAIQGEGGAPQHWVVDFTHDGRPYRALFVYGLLQRVR